VINLKSVPITGGGKPLLMFAMWRDIALAMGVRTVMQDVLLWCFGPEFFADPSRRTAVQEMDDAMESIDDEDRGGMGLRAYCAQLSAIQAFDSRDVVGKLGERTRPGGATPQIVVLAGESDILIPVSLSRELHGLIPGARWCTTRGGHACNWEFPDEFNKICLEVWREIETEADKGKDAR
jgi:3-oxoadipate enol-lactonase